VISKREAKVSDVLKELIRNYTILLTRWCIIVLRFSGVSWTLEL